MIHKQKVRSNLKSVCTVYNGKAIKKPCRSGNSTYLKQIILYIIKSLIATSQPLLIKQV